MKFLAEFYSSDHWQCEELIEATSSLEAQIIADKMSAVHNPGATETWTATVRNERNPTP